MSRSSRSLYVVYGTERKVSGITFQMCIFFPLPQVLINFASVMTNVCSLRGEGHVGGCLFSCLPTATSSTQTARRGTDSGFGRFDLATVLSPSELFPSARLPFFLRPPPPLALLTRSPLNCLGFNAEAVSSPTPVCTFIFC